METTTTHNVATAETTAETSPGLERVEAFEERLLTALNEAGMLLMVSIGHRTGLLETMERLEGAASSAEIADAAGLQERYVREWLSALTVAGVLELEDDDRFRLPAEHAALLTGEVENLAVFAQYIPELGSVESELVRCFREGGGVSYERYERFHEVMAEDSGQTVVAALHDHILSLVPGLSDRLERGIRVLDVGCGRGRALLELAAVYPGSEFVGYDLSAEAVSWARSRARERGLDNVRFEVRDVTDLDHSAEPGAFDFVTTFDAIHDQAKPLAVLRGIRRTLRPDGVYLMQDIRASSHLHENLDHPIGPLLYAISCMHCMTVSLAQGGEGLGTMWGRQKARELLSAAGFGRIEIHELPHDFQNDFYVIRP